MCNALALAGASFAVNAAQSVAKYGAAKEDAANLAAYRAQDAYNAEVDRNYKYNQIGLRQQQELDQKAQAEMDNQIKAVKARGVADAAAADSGISGNSVESVARDVYMQQGRIDAATERNTSMSIAQLQNEKEQANAQYISRTNQPAIRQPSMLGLGLEIAGGGVQAYDLYRRRQEGTELANRNRA
jgi:hypothetical protein